MKKAYLYLIVAIQTLLAILAVVSFRLTVIYAFDMFACGKECIYEVDGKIIHYDSIEKFFINLILLCISILVIKYGSYLHEKISKALNK